MRRFGWFVAALVLLALWTWQQRPHLPAVVAPRPTAASDRPIRAPQALPPLGTSPSSADADWPSFLPSEALDTLHRIERGGPFFHRQDGATFQNRERRLPARSRGYYREYTVVTPGSDDRGARRIITGGDPPIEYFYSDDHYRSFRRFTAGARQ